MGANLQFCCQALTVAPGLQAWYLPLLTLEGPRVGPQFNLEVDEVQSAARELNPWRRNISQPLVLEVRAVQFIPVFLTALILFQRRIAFTGFYAIGVSLHTVTR